MIEIKKEEYETIISHAKAGLPNEMCGLLGGRKESGTYLIEKVFPLSNQDKSPEHFTISPEDQLSAIKQMRKENLLPLGNFHSHPESPARPSEEDKHLAYDPNAIYMILSLNDPIPVLKAFRIDSQKNVTELPLTITP